MRTFNPFFFKSIEKFATIFILFVHACVRSKKINTYLEKEFLDLFCFVVIFLLWPRSADGNDGCTNKIIIQLLNVRARACCTLFSFRSLHHHEKCVEFFMVIIINFLGKTFSKHYFVRLIELKSINLIVQKHVQ